MLDARRVGPRRRLGVAAPAGGGADAARALPHDRAAARGRAGRARRARLLAGRRRARVRLRPARQPRAALGARRARRLARAQVRDGRDGALLPPLLRRKGECPFVLCVFAQVHSKVRVRCAFSRRRATTMLPVLWFHKRRGAGRKRGSVCLGGVATLSDGVAKVWERCITERGRTGATLQCGSGLAGRGGGAAGTPWGRASWGRGRAARQRAQTRGSVTQSRSASSSGVLSTFSLGRTRHHLLTSSW